MFPPVPAGDAQTSSVSRRGLKLRPYRLDGTSPSRLLCVHDGQAFSNKDEPCFLQCALKTQAAAAEDLWTQEIIWIYQLWPLCQRLFPSFRRKTNLHESSQTAFAHQDRPDEIYLCDSGTEEDLVGVQAQTNTMKSRAAQRSSSETVGLDAGGTRGSMWTLDCWRSVLETVWWICLRTCRCVAGGGSSSWYLEPRRLLSY